MKLFAAFMIVLLALAVFYIYAAGRSERVAKFIDFKNDVKEAQVQRRMYGGFTNHSRYTSVWAFTNRYVIGGTNYQCEFAGESEDFTNQGVLAITTNEVFLWIDKARGVIPLIRREMALPPGL